MRAMHRNGGGIMVRQNELRRLWKKQSLEEILLKKTASYQTHKVETVPSGCWTIQ